MADPPRHDPTLTWHGDRDEQSRVWAGMSNEDGSHARPGDRLADRFELREALGAGGMGVVFRAFDLELEETVAVKLLHTEVHAYGNALGALRREVRAARAVVSPHVVRVFELHHDADATFLVMEYIDGASLAAKVATQGRLPMTEALRALVHVATGLAATHQRGLVHRDVKPGNILLRRDESAVLADFGLSRGPTTGETGRFVPAGTPAYMPPEQALGGPLTPAADVFAFGVMAYELLAGVLPWTAPSPMELALSKARTPPAPLTARAPGVSGAVWEIVRRCLAFDPSERLRDGSMLVEALREVAGSRRPAATSLPPARSVSHEVPLVWVRPFETGGSDPALQDEAEDLREELQSELGTRRSIRVVEGASLVRLVESGGCARTAAREQGITWTVRCRLGARDETLGARLKVTRVDTDELVYSARVDFPEFSVLAAARALADHIARALAASEGAAQRPTADESGADAECQAAISLARRHLRTYDPALVDVAGVLIAHALAVTPHDPSLLALRACALARHWALSGSIAPERASELRETLGKLEASDSEDGEVRYAHAVALWNTGDGVGAARLARLAIARQPSLAGAQVMLARMLVEADFLEEGERRLEIAARIDPELSEVEVVRALRGALRQCWSDATDALSRLGDRADARRARAHWAFRIALWQKDLPSIGKLLERGLDEAGLHDDTSERQVLAKAGAVVAGRCPPEPFVVGLVRRAPIDALHWLELETEVLASVGELDAAVRSLAAALGHGSIGLGWWRRCPALEPLRTSPVGPAVAARLEHRAMRVYGAIRDVRDQD